MNSDFTGQLWSLTTFEEIIFVTQHHVLRQVPACLAHHPHWRTLYLLTDREAPLGRVIAVDIDDPANHREVIPEADEAMEHVRLVGNRLAVAYLHHAHSRLAIFEVEGRHVVDVELPGIGSIVEMSGRRRDDELFLTFATFVSPPRRTSTAQSQSLRGSPPGDRAVPVTIRSVLGFPNSTSPACFRLERSAFSTSHGSSASAMGCCSSANASSPGARASGTIKYPS